MPGLLYFYESKDELRKIIVQVKGVGVKRGDVATWLGDVSNIPSARSAPGSARGGHCGSPLTALTCQRKKKRRPVAGPPGEIVL